MELEKAASNLVFKQGISNFAFSIYDAIDKNGNECISPYSISAALLLLMLGTDGTTKNQMMLSIFQGQYPRNVHQGYKILNDKLLGRTETGVTLSIANRLFGSRIYTLLNTYTTEALRYYRSRVQLLDFASYPEESRIKINNWISEQTNNKIQDMIPRGVLNQYTVVVLANAIYFKGTWKTKFDPSDTSKADFFMGSDIPKKVDMMYGKFKAVSGESIELNCKILQLPFKGDKLSMGFILPNNINGLSRLESQIDWRTFENLLSAAWYQETVIRIPKFKVEAEYNLIPTLKKLGITEIFDFTVADFSRMVSQNGPRVYVSDALHKTFIEVNEKGSEAAASTAIVVAVESAGPYQSFQFVADHPFMFFIRDNESRTILFMGRLTNP